MREEAHGRALPCRIAATYGLHPTVEEGEALPEGYVNESWRVPCEEGAFLVRIYGRLHVTRGALLFEHAIVAHAAERLAEVRAPLSGPNGSTLWEIDDAFVAVFPFIEGRTGGRDPAARAGAARLLARFHRAMHDVHIAGGMRTTRSLGALGKLRERFVGLAHDPVLAHKLDWDVAMAAATAAAARLAPIARELPHTIVHGDVHPANFVRSRSGDATVGLIDFDFAHESERAYDVAIGIDEFARARNAAPLELDAAAAFADAYASELKLAAAERKALPDLMIRHSATLISYIVSRHGELAPGDVGGAPIYLERIREIERVREELLARVA
ncbi:MAG: phosphotransferase [Candidatus Eremiobacteraeota bacterium]|nr:phosphotransferase [Candidatus Eremiobacteraeota bacterium]